MTQRDKPHRGYATGRSRREQILRATITAFGESGYHGASLRDIAARAGLSHPGLLHHFPTKTSLLKAVLEYRDEIDQEIIEADLEQGRTVFETIIRLVERNAARRPIVDTFAVLSAEASAPTHPAHEYFSRRYSATTAWTREALVEMAAAGRLRPGVDPDTAARAIAALMDGLQIQWLYATADPPAESPAEPAGSPADPNGSPTDTVDMAADLRAYLDLITAPGH